MLSSSVSDYRKQCGEFIGLAVKYNEMYFRSIEELQLIMNGHHIAYDQLKLVTTEQSFNACFTEWLCRTKSGSGEAGWAYAIDSMATEEGIDSLALFKSLVQDFLTQWYERPEETETLE